MADCLIGVYAPDEQMWLSAARNARTGSRTQYKAQRGVSPQPNVPEKSSADFADFADWNYEFVSFEGICENLRNLRISNLMETTAA